jgi:hypothetical protein
MGCGKIMRYGKITGCKQIIKSYGKIIVYGKIMGYEKIMGFGKLMGFLEN